jgi:NhaP-type Na+/H+ or K+/H+ antiporter
MMDLLSPALILEKSEVHHRDELPSITVVTVALSALLHGVTAAPLPNLYGRPTARMGECEENQPVSEMPLSEGLAQIENNTKRTAIK